MARSARAKPAAPKDVRPDGESSSELPIVAPASEMDDETFIKHFNARHADSLKGQGPLDLVGSWPDQIATYRAFHLKIHDRTLNHYAVNHEHSQGKPGNAWQDGV